MDDKKYIDYLDDELLYLENINESLKVFDESSLKLVMINGVIKESSDSSVFDTLDKFFNGLSDTIEDKKKEIEYHIQKDKNGSLYQNAEKELESEKDRIKEKLRAKLDAGRTSVTVYDYSDNYKSFKNIVNSLFGTINRFSNKNFKTRQEVLDEFETILKIIKGFDKKMENENKRSSYLNINTCLSILDSSNYDREDVLDIQKDLIDHFKDIHKKSRELLNKANEDDVYRARSQYLNLIAVKELNFVLKWCKFFSTTPMIKINMN